MADTISAIIHSFKGTPDASTNAIPGIIQSYQTPRDVTNATAYLGKQYDNGLCQAFVEQMTQGKTGIYPSAAQAWNAQLSQARGGINGIKPGDTIYFSPNIGNNYDGHTGIYQGDNKFISATDKGVEVNDLSDWSTKTGQNILGYIPQG